MRFLEIAISGKIAIFGFNGPFGPGAADPEITISGKITFFGFFVKINIFDIFPVFWVRERPGNLGEAGGTQKIKKNQNFFRPKNRHPYIKSNLALFGHLDPSNDPFEEMST